MNTLVSNPDIRIIDSLADINPQQWNVLAGEQPFLRHEFLFALETTGCVSQQAGWIPRHITLWKNNVLTGAMPLYVKSHSYGEYVFDWAWADAYQRHGIRYYPKLVNATPFTPVTGQRLLAATESDRLLLLSAALKHAQDIGASSLHCLFPTQPQAKEMQSLGMMLRSGVQFHWQNNEYADFDGYLANMSHDKRKKIKQERRKVSNSGITFEHLTGNAICDTHWEFFNSCYQTTYRQHRSTPYLNLAFFRQIGATQPENVLLIIASRDGIPIASALNFYNDHTLYGRYWGAIEYAPGLHFETCYYQAIEFCIQHKILTFEGGAQGEHKVARGFLPTPTWSAHWLAHPEFSHAVEEFLERESRGIAQYITELNESSPFKSEKPSI
nr:GNAT family N-acetyltransferase [Sulfurirhabdus autotrophica]